MGSEVILEKPYGAAVSGDWKSMIEYYQEHFEYFFSPVTHSLDTVLHLAVHSNEEQPLKDLLEIVKERVFFCNWGRISRDRKQISKYGSSRGNHLWELWGCKTLGWSLSRTNFHSECVRWNPIVYSCWIWWGRNSGVFNQVQTRTMRGR